MAPVMMGLRRDVEVTSRKRHANAALRRRRITGMVSKPRTIGFEDLVRMMVEADLARLEGHGANKPGSVQR